MKTFFTSDPHLGHTNIIKYCNRPFSTVEEMNEAFVANWNAKVSHEDEVYILGDFSNIRDERCAWYFHRLNGTKHLIIGNHDLENKTVLSLPWASMEHMKELTVDRQRLVLCHYPMMSWNKIGKGAINLFGHMHGNFAGTEQSIDVGVDVFNFTPVTLQEIYPALKKNKIGNVMAMIDEGYRAKMPRGMK